MTRKTQHFLQCIPLLLILFIPIFIWVTLLCVAEVLYTIASGTEDLAGWIGSRKLKFSEAYWAKLSRNREGRYND